MASHWAPSMMNYDYFDTDDLFDVSTDDPFDDAPTFNINNIHIWLPSKRLLDELNNDYIKNNKNMINNIIEKIYGNHKK